MRSSTLVQAVAADCREDMRAADEAAMEAGVNQAEVDRTVAVRSLWLITSEGVPVVRGPQKQEAT